MLDYDEIVVPLPFPCHRSGTDFVDASNRKHIDIQPTHWRKWTRERLAVAGAIAWAPLGVQAALTTLVARGM